MTKEPADLNFQIDRPQLAHKSMNCILCNNPMSATSLDGENPDIHHSCGQCLKFSCYTKYDETIVRFYIYINNFGIRSHHQNGWIVSAQTKQGRWQPIDTNSTQYLAPVEALTLLKRYMDLKAFL